MSCILNDRRFFDPRTGLVHTTWPASPGSIVALSQGEARPGVVQERIHWGCRPGCYPGMTADIVLQEINEGRR